MRDSTRSRRHPIDARAAALGIAVYFVLALSPLVLMLVAPLPTGRAFLRELSVALGFAGVSILGLQFALTARFGRLEAPYGIDAVYHFHREVSYVALGLVIAHPVLLFVSSPASLVLLNVVTAPWRTRFAILALLSLIVLIATSVLRTRFRLGYETWRITHGLLAIAVIAFSVAHMEGVGYYVNVPWKRVAWAGYLAFWTGLIVYVRVLKPLGQLRRPYRVTEVRSEAPGVWTLGFEPQGHPGIAFLGGQFAWLTLGTSPFRYEEHPFSFSSSANVERGGFAMTVKELGDHTSRIGETCIGEVAYLDGPYGAFTLEHHPGREIVFVVGGIGITPAMSILRTAAAQGASGRMSLVYAAATVDDFAFRAEIDELSGQVPVKVVYVVADPPPDWHGEKGFVTADILRRSLSEAALEDGQFFVCGPPAMMASLESVLAELRVDPRRHHYEQFDLV